MSGYYAKVSNISGGKSCVATSAYMSREKMKDEQMNHTFNYCGHEHDNTFSSVTLCKGAPEEWQDKEKLWNAVESEESGKNTRKAKQWILAIPQGMSEEQAQDAVKEFQSYLAEKGMCSQADIHEPESKRSASRIEKNVHVHVLATQRKINEHGEWEQIKEKKVYANCRDAEGKPAYNPDIPNDTAHRIAKIDPNTGLQKIGARNRKEWERVTIQDNPFNKKEFIEESRSRRSRAEEIKAALGIRGRELTPTERKYVFSWLDMGFSVDALSVAYDRTVTNTGSLKWNYMNKIVSSWHQKGIHTVQEIEEKDRRTPTPAKNTEPNAPASQAELARLRSIYEKVKNT